MQCYRFALVVFIVATQLDAAIVYSDANPPRKWTYQEVVAGSLDNNFGTNGKVTTAVGSGNDAAYGIAIQTDRKLVVIGYSHNGSNDDFALVRYKPDGSLDSSFGTNGKVTTAVGSSDDYGYDVAIQPDGKLVVVGYSYNGSNYDFALVRYNSDGSLDSSFGTNGKVTTAIGSGNDYGYEVIIQPDGKLVVAGYSNNGSNDDFALVRYNADGSLDSSFGTGGKVTTAIGSGNDAAYALIIQPDGKLVVAGYSNNGSNDDFAVVRYNSDGSLDSSFGTGGKVTTAIGSSHDVAYGIAIQTDGKLVVAGYSHNGSNFDFAIVRYNTDGSLDSSFGTGGKVTTAVGSSQDYGYALVIQPDGKPVVAGHSNNGSDYDFAIVRYNTDGSLDSSFGTGGKVTTAVGSSQDYGYGIAIQPDGKLVVVGYSYNGSNYDFALVRYENNIPSLNLVRASSGLVG